MPKLVVNPTSTSRREIKLSRTLLSIGRDPSNDLVLPDAMVSRRHAVIECRGTQYYLRDCNSSNGSVVNGDKVSERSLRDGDLVAIGTARLLFREELDLEDPGAKIVQHPSAPRLLCPSCKKDYRKGDLFCRECGAPLQAPAGPPKAVCASCGTAVVLPAKFCNACGGRLMTEDAPPPSTAEQEPVPPAGGSPSGESGRRETASAEVAVSRPVFVESPLAPALGPPPTEEEGHPAAPLLLEDLALQPEAAPRPATSPDPKRPLARPSGDRDRAARAPVNERPGRRPLVALTPAGFGRRFLAALADGLLLSILQAVVVGPLAFYAPTLAASNSTAGGSVLPVLVTVAIFGLAALVGASYYVCFWALSGATPGKRWAGLRVVAEDGTPVGWGRAAARAVGYAVSMATLGIGFLLIAKDGIGLHDRIAGTRVVSRRAGE